MLHGAEVTAPRIDVKAAQLEITSPQNSYDYHSVTRTAGGSLSVPLNNPAATSAGGNFQHQVLKDHFVSTGKTLSGLYAGDQGIGIDVAGNTSLTAGVISSTASREKNHFNTGSLTAQNLENISRWQLESAGFQGSFGGAGQGDAHSWLGQVGQGMAANSMSLLGGGRDHDERTVSHSAVSDNITINTTSISGDLSRDVAYANGALDNKFNAQKLQNQMQASQLGTQLVGEVMGRVSDELFSHGVPGFDERSATNNWARALLEAGGNAAVAAGTGGNVGAAAASVFAGTIVSGATRNWADSMATALTGQSSGGYGSQAKLHDSLMNLLSNGIASAAGAVGGLVAGPGSSTVNVLNGAAAASAIQQYNQAVEKVLEKGLPRAVGLIAGKASEEVIEGLVEDSEVDINKYGRELFEPVDRGISRSIRQIGDILGSAISYGQRLSDVSSGMTAVTSQNAENVISSPAQAQMLKDYIFSVPVLSDFAISLGTGTRYTGSNNSSQNVSSSGGSGAGGQEPDDEESQQRKIREDSNKSPALEDSPYNPAAVSARNRPPYETNPSHDPRSSDFIPSKDPEPPDVEEVYHSNSIRFQKGTQSAKPWYGFGERGIYRFSDNNAGEMHFSGIMKGNDRLPSEVKRYFSEIMKVKIK